MIPICTAAVHRQSPENRAREACATSRPSGGVAIFTSPTGPTRSTAHSTITRSLPLRPKVSGAYISSALAGGTTNTPGVVARAM